MLNNKKYKISIACGMSHATWDEQLKLHLQLREDFCTTYEKVSVFILDDTIGRRIMSFISVQDPEQIIFDVTTVRTNKDLIDKKHILPDKIRGFPCVRKEKNGPLLYSVEAIKEIRSAVDNMDTDPGLQHWMEIAKQSDSEDEVLNLLLSI
jgi:hypothetical protein